MKYALGNMLNGAGGLNADQLALDLQFAADKTLTARKGPTPVFTRASSGTFVGSNGLIQSAGNNIARFDHDPVTLASRGLLIEESRTNLVLQSENHTSATWSKTGGSVSSVANTAPDGSANSNLFSEDSSTGAHRIFQSTAYVSGTVYTISVFLKYAGRQFIAIQHPVVAANNSAIFDIQNGVVTLTQSGVTTSISQYPNGWYRCSVTGTSTMTSSQSSLLQGSTSGTVLATSYTGLNGPAFYIYGSQVEAGSFPTSYIPTTTASVVRSAEVCSISGAAFSGMWNASEGTVYSSFQRNTLVDGLRTFAISTGASGNSIQLFKSGSNENLVHQSPTGTYTLVLSTSSLNNTKIANAFKSGDHAASMNGVVPVTNSNVGLITPDRFSIGSNHAASLAFINGTITSIRYYRKRLDNAKLQTLTV